jgi:hypothetical protein
VRKKYPEGLRRYTIIIIDVLLSAHCAQKGSMVTDVNVHVRKNGIESLALL